MKTCYDCGGLFSGFCWTGGRDIHNTCLSCWILLRKDIESLQAYVFTGKGNAGTQRWCSSCPQYVRCMTVSAE